MRKKNSLLQAKIRFEGLAFCLLQTNKAKKQPEEIKQSLWS
jgi:hypothetical protein